MLVRSSTVGLKMKRKKGNPRSHQVITCMKRIEQINFEQHWVVAIHQVTGHPLGNGGSRRGSGGGGGGSERI